MSTQTEPTEIEKLQRELDKARKQNTRLNAELDKGDSWTWIREKFEKCGKHLTWYKPRTDGLAGTRYEIMGWLHCLFANANPKVYIDIAVEQQKKADDALKQLAALQAVLPPPPANPEKVWRHLVKRMFDECGTTKAEDFIKRVEAGEHDVPSPWASKPFATTTTPITQEQRNVEAQVACLELGTDEGFIPPSSVFWQPYLNLRIENRRLQAKELTNAHMAWEHNEVEYNCAWQAALDLGAEDEPKFRAGWDAAHERPTHSQPTAPAPKKYISFSTPSGLATDPIKTLFLESSRLEAAFADADRREKDDWERP